VVRRGASQSATSMDIEYNGVTGRGRREDGAAVPFQGRGRDWEVD
jgi:hypothetical protein